MASRRISGGPLEGVVVTLVPAASWTDAASDDLVKHGTGGNYEAVPCGNNDVPAGVVRSVSPGGRALAVELFTSGAIVRVPYTGTPSLGQQVQASATTTVKGVASGGTGRIVAIGIEAGKVDVLFA